MDGARREVVGGERAARRQKGGHAACKPRSTSSAGRHGVQRHCGGDDIDTALAGTAMAMATVLAAAVVAAAAGGGGRRRAAAHSASKYLATAVSSVGSRLSLARRRHLTSSSRSRRLLPSVSQMRKLRDSPVMPSAPRALSVRRMLATIDATSWGALSANWPVGSRASGGRLGDEGDPATGSFSGGPLVGGGAYAVRWGLWHTSSSSPPTRPEPQVGSTSKTLERICCCALRGALLAPPIAREAVSIERIDERDITFACAESD